MLAPNGEESRLYTDILAHPDVQGDENLAVDLYLTAYTPSFKSYFGDFENGEIKGIVDNNNEPFVASVINFLNVPEKKETRVIKKAAEAPKEKEPVTEVKPGVEELFDSNPELANQVYQALGFKTFDTKGVSLDVKDRDGWKWIKLNGKNIGEVKLVKNDKRSKEVGLSIKLNEEYQNKGYGQIVHTLVADWAKNEFGDTLYSDFDNSKAEINTLLALTKKGFAEQIGNYGVEEDGRYSTEERAFRIKTSDEIQQITPQQKQQALQLYSQYLDTVFPNSKVKDIVYHGTKAEFDKFDKSKLGSKQDIEGFKEFVEIAPKFQKEAPTEVPVMKNVANVKKVLDRLKEKFGIDYEIVNEPEADWKGKFENGKVYINGAKDITKDTAFHEYLHPFVSALKIENPALHEKLLNELQSLEDGRAEIEAVRQSGGYAGLTEEEILDEALVSYLGKLASGNITLTGDVVESKVERVRQSMLSQFTNWLKKMFSRLFSVKIKDFNLKYNLQDIANIVSASDVKIDVSGLPINSTPQYQFDEETKKFKQKIKNQANDVQNMVIDDILFEAKPGQPDMGRVILEEENHVYIHTQTGQTYKSVTTAIKGELNDPEGLYELNRIFGNHFDKILQNIILGKTYEESKADMTGAISEEVSKEAYKALQGYVIGVMSDGSIILPQVILADPQSGIAGSLDIFIVKPDGKVFITDLKVSKNSYKSNYYRTEKHDVGNGSVFTGQKLTTQQQHGIQVATYKRLAEVNGYQVEGISTLHIILNVEGKTKEQKVKDFQWEGLQVHQPSSNETFVNKVVPTKSNRNKVKGFKKVLGIHNPANDDDFLDDEEASPESAEIPEDTKNLLQNTLNIYVEKLYQRMEYLKNLNKTRFSVFSESSRENAIDRISELLTSIEVENLGKPDRAFGALLRYTKETLDNLYRYINDPSNVNKPGYIDVILEAEKFIESYRDIASVPEIGLGSQEQYKEMRAVQSRLNAVKAEINPALEAYVKDLIKTKTGSELTEEELDKLLKEGFDIDLGEYGVTDMQNTKERLLAIAANLYTEANQKAFNNTDGIIERIKKAGNRLSSALASKKIDFSYLNQTRRDKKKKR